MRVAVALSGGIDSAVAALLLKQRLGCNGHIEGVFMQNWDARIEEEGQQCTVESDYDDARRVADSLQIPLHRTNFVRDYWHGVFARVLAGYEAGRTPNPDIMCNREIKMGSLLRWCQQHCFDRLATGHYARLIRLEGRLWIGQAVDQRKDQSYFLADTPMGAMPSLLLPIGELPSKHAVRHLARSNNLGFLLDKAESMGICFVGKRRKFPVFLSTFLRARPREVRAVEGGGRLGVCEDFVTVGQSVRIAGLPRKLFCVGRDEERGTILASYDREHPLLRPLAIVVKGGSSSNGHDLQDLPIDQLSCSIRSSEKRGTPLASITRLGDQHYRLEAVRGQPFMAPAPGQVAVTYRRLPSGERIVVGCGEIESSDRDCLECN